MAQTNDRNPRIAALVVVGVAAVILALTLWWSAGEPAAPPPTTAAPRPPAPAADPPGDADGDDAPTGPSAEGLRRVIGATHPNIPPSTRPFDSPDQASSYVRGKVMDLLAAIAPEIRPEDVQMECDPDGRICRFWAPWPGDDLLKRWLKAITEGRTSQEAMGGVMFSRFAPVQTGDVTELEIEAHAP